MGERRGSRILCDFVVSAGEIFSESFGFEGGNVGGEVWKKGGRGCVCSVGDCVLGGGLCARLRNVCTWDRVLLGYYVFYTYCRQCTVFLGLGGVKNGT